MATITGYATKGGKRYRVRYRKPDGSQTDKRGFKTKKQAEIFSATVEVSKAHGDYLDPTAGRITISELGTPWLAAQTHLKPSSLDPVERTWRVYVQPRWGSTTISSIKHSDVQAWVSAVTTGDAIVAEGHVAGPRSATVVLRAYGILASILDSAVLDRRLPRNPARGVNLPRKGKKPRAYLSHQRVQLLANGAGDNATLILFLAYTGLRWGEATALRISDLDTLRRRATVEQNAVNVAGRIVLGTPKSHEQRTVPYPKFLSLPIARLCKGKERGQLLFGDGVSYLRTPDTRGWFKRAVDAAQTADKDFPRVTPHDLRHTAASLAISAGANVKAVQRMMGHASAAMTLDTYADLFDDDLEAVAVALDNARNVSNVGKMWASGSEGQRETPSFPAAMREEGGQPLVPPLGFEPRLERF